jgi:hypothetical protein
MQHLSSAGLRDVTAAFGDAKFARQDGHGLSCRCVAREARSAVVATLRFRENRSQLS